MSGRADDGADSHAAIAWAERLDGAQRRRSRLFTGFLLGFGTATLVATAAPGFLGVTWAGAAFAAVYGGCGAVIAGYASREPGAAGEFLRRHARSVAVWAVLYFAVVSAGVIWFPSALAWWIPGAAVTATPWFVAAYLEMRDLRRTGSRDEVR